MAKRNVVDFKIINLSEEKFQELKEAGQIDPNAIYCTPDETVAKFEEINTEIEALKDKVGIPLLSPMWADHTLNDMSWLNADTFSWQSGDVYVAAYEHLASEAIFESETKKYVRVKTLNAAHDGWREDNNIYYREPSYDLSDDIVYDEGYAFAWVAASSNMMVITNTETPTESDVIYYRSKIYPENPPPFEGRVIEAGEETLYSNAETETIDGIAITFCRAEDGHKICPAGQEANVQALYEKTGVAWYYIIDEANKQFKLPRTKFGFTGLRDSVGGYVKAGLPNITGDWYSNTPTNYTASGAIYGKTVSATNVPATTGSSKYGFGFDASRSSSVYGNSNTVQPEATQMYLYFYVGNFEQSALEQTAGITSEQLNTKADTDLSNTQFSLLKNNNGALSWNDINMSAMCMPSKNIAIDLTLGASGANYTVPADGYIRCVIAADPGGYLGIHNCYWQNGTNSGAYIGGMIPVLAGAIVGINYSGKQSAVNFKFIYAKGSEHLA